MIGKPMGQLQSIPAPSAATLNEALKLLATFGDSKGLSKLLEQVKEVQEHNEQVLRDAQAALSALKTTQDALNDSKDKFVEHVASENSSLRRRSDELSVSEAKLSGRIAKFNQEQSAAKEKIAEAEESLSIAEQAVRQREIACEVKEQELSHREAGLRKLDNDLSVYANQLQAKEKKLRAALDGG